MTVEIRQMLIRSLITEEGQAEPVRDAQTRAKELQQMREQVLAECKAWLTEQLRASNER